VAMAKVVKRFKTDQKDPVSNPNTSKA